MNNNPENRQPPSRNGSQGINAKQAALYAEQRRIEKIRKKRSLKMFWDKAIAILTLSLIGTAICLFAIFGYIFFDYSKGPDIPKEPVKITLNDEIIVLENDYYFFRNGEYYVSLTELCEILGLTLHGNVHNMTLSAADGTGARFNIGTPCVKVGSTYSVLQNPTYFEKEQLFIPCSFFTSHCSGVDAEYNKDGKTKGYNLIFSQSFGYKGKNEAETASIPYGSASHVLANQKPDFIADLSEYEMYMNPENRDEYLVLVNTQNKLASDYVPSDLTDVIDTRRDRSRQKMRLYAAKALEAMFIEMRANGFHDVSVTSGYRSYDYQVTLFNNEIAMFRPSFGDKAEDEAKKWVAIPGSSEHQSGLCVDMHNLPSASTAFASQAAYKWLYSNCAEFGFILRYPKDKTDITGIAFEPWHYRYVGRYHAKKIMDEGLCLEEYVASLNG